MPVTYPSLEWLPVRHQIRQALNCQPLHFKLEPTSIIIGRITMDIFEHQDTLNDIDRNIELGKKLTLVHDTLKTSLPFISHIAATLYDNKTDTLKTFVYSGEEKYPLVHYQAKLSDAPSLLEILHKGRPRVVNNLAIFASNNHEHAKHINKQGFLSSYTMPMYVRGTLFGFLFFNSYELSSFTEEVLRKIDPYGHLISLIIINDLASIQTMMSAVKAARDMAHLHDYETGTHQDRMSHYAQLIAQNVAAKYNLTDEYIENIFVFSVLHDIGKIGLPDSILQKPSRLTDEEFTIMKSHAIKGKQLINQLLDNFELNKMPHIAILRNIAELHHEALDGSGYPYGRKAEDIPIEARITAVADIFDALTSRRPYKQAWTNDDAFAVLKQLSGVKLDPDCVNALIESREEIEKIQRRFSEDIIG